LAARLIASDGSPLPPSSRHLKCPIERVTDALTTCNYSTLLTCTCCARCPLLCIEKIPRTRRDRRDYATVATQAQPPPPHEMLRCLADAASGGPASRVWGPCVVPHPVSPLCPTVTVTRTLSDCCWCWCCCSSLSQCCRQLHVQAQAQALAVTCMSAVPLLMGSDHMVADSLRFATQPRPGGRIGHAYEANRPS
jgi:hypothetical protein